jgi:hypothetical protein
MGHLKDATIIVQQDGAKPHTGKNNVELLNEFGCRGGWKISFETQPPQSPDLNKLDLCFFHSLQTQAEALKDAENSLEDDMIVDRVTQVYTDYSTEQLSRVHD